MDVPLALSAPVNLTAASPNGVVAIGWRGVGCCSQSASAAFNADGRQWRAIATPWDDRPNGNLLARSFGVPRALAYGDGTFLSVGQRVDVSDDFKQTTNIIGARSTDGINWEEIDLRVALGAASPTQLIRFGGRWLMAAEPVNSTPARQTLMFSSPDGTTWDLIATLDFRVRVLARTDSGLMAISGDINSPTPFSALSEDGRTWRTMTLELRALSSLSSVLVDADRVVLVVTERDTGNSQEKRLRLFASRDGLTWQSIPTPPCSAGFPGEAGAVGGTWAIVVDTETPTLTVSHDHGAAWSCTALTGEVFETNPRWGPPFLTNIVDVKGKLALVGGRTIEPGAKGNWAAAIWYLS